MTLHEHTQEDTAEHEHPSEIERTKPDEPNDEYGCTIADDPHEVCNGREVRLFEGVYQQTGADEPNEHNEDGKLRR